MDRAGRIAFAIAVLTLLLVVATAVLFTFDGAVGSDPVSNVLLLLAVACYAVVGGLIASRLPRNASGWLLLVIGLGLVVTTGTDVGTTVAIREGRAELATWTLWLNSWFLVVTAWPGIVLDLLVFPSGRLPSRRWRPFVIGVLALSVLGGVAHMAQPWEGEPITNPVSTPGVSSVAGTLFLAISLAFAAAAIVVVASVVLRFRRASSSDRQALRWLAVVGGLAAALRGGARAGGRSDRVGTYRSAHDRRSVRRRLPPRTGARPPLLSGGRVARAPRARYRRRGEPLPRVREPRGHDHGDLRGGRGGRRRRRGR